MKMIESILRYRRSQHKTLVLLLPFLFITMAVPSSCLCQPSYFSTDPVWSSDFANATFSVAFGDVDGDGDLDLLCGNYLGNNTLYMNDGGAFQSIPVWSSGPANGTVSIAFGDVDGDGDLDLACGNYLGSNTLYLNDEGVLQSNPAWSSGPTNDTRSIALGDVDGDGDLDLVCGNNQRNTLYLNIGGVFQSNPVWSSGPTNATLSIALGDVDRDGDLDLVCGNYTQDNTLYLNEGGVFQPDPVWSAEPFSTTSGVALGDVDGDGDLDLVCGNRQNNTLYLNDGSVFQTTPIWSSGPARETYAVALGDADGDGDLDLVCSNDLESNALYLNDGGVFESAPAWNSGPKRHTYGLALGDVDGDGDLDVICGNDMDSNVLYLSDRGAFQSAPPQWTSGPLNGTFGIAIGDVDGDGDLDLACGNINESNTLYLSDGDVYQTNPVWSSAPTNATYCIALGDVDGDENLDLVCGNDGQSNTLYLNDGGMFQPIPVWSSGPAHHTYGVALGDVDGDGDLDLVCGNSNENNTLYLNDGGVFQSDPVWSSAPANATVRIALGDVDADGDLDLVCSNFGQSNTLYLNSGGMFQSDPAWSSWPASETFSVALGDVNGNGDLDLVCGNNESNTVYLNSGGVFQSTPVWHSGPANATTDVALGDVDADGDLDLVCGNYVGSNTLYLNSGGVLQALPIWFSSPANSTRRIALGDVDADGDLDLVCGNFDQSNTLYKGITSPAFKGDPLAPANHLPNNSAHLRFVSAEKLDITTYRVLFTAIDLESDPVWILPEYQYKGDPTCEGDSTWCSVEVIGQPGKVGPFATSPGGVMDSLDWDTHLLPFDRRDVVLRLRTISVPRRVSLIQHIVSYSKEIGPIEPYRPLISTSADTLSYSTITVGDTASNDITIRNRGNALLTITDIELPSPEMRLSPSAPFDLAPGEQDTVTLFLEPRSELVVSGDVRIHSNDPITPTLTIGITTDIRALKVQTRLLNPSEEVPLGEALTINVIPEPEVEVEKGYVYYRAAGMGLAFGDSIELAPLVEGDFIAVIPGEAVTEADLEYFVKVQNGTVTATDPPDAPDSVFFQAVESPASISSAPQPNEGQAFIEGRDIRVFVTLPAGAGFVQGKLFFRRGGKTDTLEADIQPADPLLFATIPGSLAGPRGLEYWVEVQTLTATLTDPPSKPALFPRTIRVSVNNLEEEGTHPGGLYRMMSIPLEMEGPITGVLTDDIGGPDKTRWRMFAYDTNGSAYIEAPNDTLGLSHFEQGRGYWLITKEAHRLDTGPAKGLSTPTDSFFAITLAPGWNMIGDPFAFPVTWESCMLDTLSMAEAESTLVEPPVAWGINGGYRYNERILESFDGYWVKNLDTLSHVLKIPPREAPEAIPSITPVFAADSPDETSASMIDWRIEIRASSGSARDFENFVGMTQGAETGWDKHDRSEPPMSPGGALSLFFPHAKWIEHAGNYTFDIRGDYEALDVGALPPSLREKDLWGHVWHFDVAKNFSVESASDDVSLTFIGVESLPEDALVYLIDKHLGRLIDLREEAACYAFYLGRRPVVATESDARFIFLAGSEDFIDTNRDLLPNAPVKTALYQNYPNPFNPSTIIRYDLAKGGTVDLRIYDVSGALVKVLECSQRNPGRYEVGWNGDNENGANVSSGVYFYRLKTEDFTQTRKMILLK